MPRFIYLLPKKAFNYIMGKVKYGKFSNVFFFRLKIRNLHNLCEMFQKKIMLSDYMIYKNEINIFINL